MMAKAAGHPHSNRAHNTVIGRFVGAASRHWKGVAAAAGIVATGGLIYNATKPAHREQTRHTQPRAEAKVRPENIAMARESEAQRASADRMMQLNQFYGHALKGAPANSLQVLEKTMQICGQVRGRTNYTVSDFSRAMRGLSIYLTDPRYSSVQKVWKAGNQRTEEQFGREVGVRVGSSSIEGEWALNTLWRTGRELTAAERNVLEQVLRSIKSQENTLKIKNK